MPQTTFAVPDLTTFCRLDRLGLEAVGQHLEHGRTVLEYRVIERDDWCQACGCAGVPRDTVTRHLAHEPMGWRPTILLVRVRHYQCTGCGRTWRQDMGKAAAPRAKISRGALQWALAGIVIGHLSISRIAAGLGVAWHTANNAALAEGRRVLIDDPGQVCERVRDRRRRTRLTAHEEGRQVRHRHHRSHPEPQ